MPNTVCVVPSIRPEQMTVFRRAWKPLFDKHDIALVIVWDGDNPVIECERTGMKYAPLEVEPFKSNRDLFCRKTDGCRNLGFVHSAFHLEPNRIFTADDDVTPLPMGPHLGDYDDPIQSHLDALDRRVPLSWMNTAHDTDLYVRGVPYGVRDESPVMLSHGVWVGVPDFDGETQLKLEKACRDCCGEGKLPDVPGYRCGRCNGTGKEGVPHSLPYYVGPVPRGVLFPLCGMNVMVRAEALPYLYFAPMGMDAGVTQTCRQCSGNGFVNIPGTDHEGRSVLGRNGICGECDGSGITFVLHRFADIFMGVFLKREFDRRNWACVTGYSTVLHTRASDAKKNYEQEKLGREWMEYLAPRYNAHSDIPMTPPDVLDTQFDDYFHSYADKRRRYADLVNSILGE